MQHDIGRRNNVRIFGQGTQPMLFAHGFGCDQHMWRYITPAFEQQYRIVLFDYVGAGKSDIASYRPDRYASLEGYAMDILEVCEAFDLRNVVLVGHSVSSMIGLLAAIRRPELFSRLIMVGPSPCYINEAGYTGGFERADIEGLLEIMERNYIGWANFLAPNVMKNADRPELAEELKESFCSTDPVIAHQFARATFLSDNRTDISKCRTPTLILQCAEDMIAPQAVGEYLHQHLPHNTLRLMKAIGHCPHLSEPGETIDMIRDYLGQTL